MARTILTHPRPVFPEMIGEDTLLVSLNSSEAAKRGWTSTNLNELARRAIRTKGLSIASSAVARHTLKSVIRARVSGFDAASLARRILAPLQIVLRTGIDADLLIKHGSLRTKQLGEIAIAYRDKLRTENLIDGNELLLTAAKCEPEPLKLFIYGYHRARKEEVEFIDAIAGEKSTFSLPCGEDAIFEINRSLATVLENRGWTCVGEGRPAEESGERLAERFVNSAVDLPSVAAFAYGNVEEEVRGVLAEIKQIVLEGHSLDEIAVVVRDQDRYAPVIAAVGTEYGIPVRTDHTVPIGSTAFGGFIRLLIDAIGSDFPFESTLRLVTHPYGPTISGNNLAQARRSHPSGRENWGNLCADLNELDWPELWSFSKWSGSLRLVLKKFGVRGKTATRAEELTAHNSFSDALSSVEALESERPIPFGRFAESVSEILTDESTPLHTAKAGIRVAEPEKMVGSSYETIFVLGNAEALFPRPVGEDPVVDFFERKELARNGVFFAEAAEVARWEALSFYFTLLAARRRLSFSYPKIVENGESFPSSFFARLGIETVPDLEKQSYVSSLEEQRRVLLRHDAEIVDEVIGYARDQFMIEERRESSEPFDEYDGVIGIPYDPATRTWSASQLTTIGQCSFRWFAQRLLRLEPLEEMEIGLDATKRGLLYHKTLEIAVSKAKDAADIRAATLENLEDAFALAEKDAEVGLPVLPNWETERVEQIRDLRKAVMAADFISDGARVVGVEQKFKDVWNGFPLVGYIDRVDDTTEGLTAIDYKTSGSVPKGAKDRSGKLTVDVQLPLYANVALARLYPEGRLGTSAYYSLTKGKVLRKVNPGDLESLELFAEDIKKILSSGSFAVDPDAGELACNYCEFDIVCRKGPRLRRKSR